jgi:hypothetical protein
MPRSLDAEGRHATDLQMGRSVETTTDLEALRRIANPPSGLQRLCCPRTEVL